MCEINSGFHVNGCKGILVNESFFCIFASWIRFKNLFLNALIEGDI